jgi:succinate dehydrogenase / fumarate reductase membrane anchor subunit
MMNYKTPLAKARGLGSAHNGTQHWWWQRLSAILLIPLFIWPLALIQQLAVANPIHIRVWLAEPWNTWIAIAWISVAFYHAAMGMQIVIEDYLQPLWWKIAMVWIIKLGLAALGLAELLIVLKFFLALN